MASLQPLTGTLGIRRAKHLLRRLSFRYTKSKVDSIKNLTANQALLGLLTPSTLQYPLPLYDPNPTDGAPAESFNHLATADFPAEDFVLRQYVINWWLHEAYLDQGVGHKMELFLHQFNVTSANTTLCTNYFDYLQLNRFYALGNFKKYIYKMVADNVMLRYLNNQQNTAANPNENFAREFFELFTIGKGPQIGPGDYTNYTEDDIVAAAKVFTGWRVSNRLLPANLDPETNIPIGQPQTGQHNWTEKKFTSKFQELTIPEVKVNNQKTTQKMRDELTMLVDRVFQQDETARNFCRRIYRFFVSRNITSEIENDIIGPLAQTFKNNNFEIKSVLTQLFQSKHFFDSDDQSAEDEIVGGLIKSPLELMFQSLSFFGIAAPDAVQQNKQNHNFFFRYVYAGMLNPAGMPLFQPSDVAGYPAYYQNPELNRQWFNSSTIISRYKLGQNLLTGVNLNFGIQGQPTNILKLDFVRWVKTSGFFTDASDPYALVQELCTYLLPEEPDAKRFNYYYNDIFLDNLPPADWTYEWQNYLATGNQNEVKIPLERLLKTLLFSAEYQLM